MNQDSSTRPFGMLRALTGAEAGYRKIGSGRDFVKSLQSSGTISSPQVGVLCRRQVSPCLNRDSRNFFLARVSNRVNTERVIDECILSSYRGFVRAVPM